MRPLPRRTRASALIFVLLALASLEVRAQGSTFKVVVNAQNPVGTLTAKEASDAFLGRLTRWPDGSPVKPVDQSATSSVRAAFSRDIHGKKVDAVMNHWQQVIFSGKGVPPPSRPTDQDVLDYVRATRGAIGYVSEGATAPDVKAIVIVR